MSVKWTTIQEWLLFVCALQLTSFISLERDNPTWSSNVEGIENTYLYTNIGVGWQVHEVVLGIDHSRGCIVISRGELFDRNLYLTECVQLFIGSPKLDL